MSYWDNTHFYIVGRHVNGVDYKFVTLGNGGADFTDQSMYASVFTNPQQASDAVEQLNHENTWYTFSVMGAETGEDILGNNLSRYMSDTDYMASTKKSVPNDDIDEEQRMLISTNGKQLGVSYPKGDASETLIYYEYKGQVYEFAYDGDTLTHIKPVKEGEYTITNPWSNPMIGKSFSEMVKSIRTKNTGVQKSRFADMYVDDMTEDEDYMQRMICDLCQCSNPFFERRSEGLIMLMSIFDSDCEYYFEEFNIQQETIDGKIFNTVNLSKLSASKMREQYGPGI